MLDVNKLCYGCMRNIQHENGICPYCGFDIHKYKKGKSVQSLETGTILDGKYLLGKVLGEGGFGITYIALDLNLEIVLAIKEFFPNGIVFRDTITTTKTDVTLLDAAGQSQYQYMLQRYVQEAKSLGKFRNDNGIVSVNSFFFQNGTAYMVMDYIKGQSLLHYLKVHNVPLSVDETLKIMKPILDSLVKVHREGVVHRDISPDNIMLSEDGGTYLIDFGAARMTIGNDVKSYTVILKHGYAPIEQYQRNGKQGSWTDIYALCATIYRMVSGIRPEDSVDRIEFDPVKPLKKLGLGVDPHFSDVVEKGMSIKAYNRWQSVEELTDALFNRDAATEGTDCSDSKAEAQTVDKTKIISRPETDAGDRDFSTERQDIDMGTVVVFAMMIIISCVVFFLEFYSVLNV